jgi:predicted transcriptional regulator
MSNRYVRIASLFYQETAMRLHDENASFRFNQTGLRKFLGDLECEIMELVWKKANPTVTVREIYDILRRERQIAYTTVMTTMVRLAEKGLLRIVDKAGLANCYSPQEGREEFIRNTVAHILEIFTKEFPQESKAFFQDGGRKAEKKPAARKGR